MKLSPHGKSYQCVEKQVRDFLEFKRLDLYFYKSGKDIGGPVIINKVPIATLKKIKKRVESKKILSAYGKYVAVKIAYERAELPLVFIPHRKKDLWVTTITVSIA